MIGAWADGVGDRLRRTEVVGLDLGDVNIDEGGVRIVGKGRSDSPN